MTSEVFKDDTLYITLDGRLDVYSVGALWRRFTRLLESNQPDIVVVRAEHLDYCDAAGIGLIINLRSHQTQQGRAFDLQGLPRRYDKLLTLFDPGTPTPVPPARSSFFRIIEDIGRNTLSAGRDIHAQISFAGEVAVKFCRTLVHPHRVKWTQVLSLAERAGVDAVGIAGLLGFLIGLILAFQSAVAMKKFGAEIYVADLVVISLFRELGPLITAFVLASRSGSAFAAEIGTMKIDEEIDALTTMGFDPTDFLVIPRIMAGIIALPLLTIFNIFCGLVGCAVVMVLMGYPVVTFIERMQSASGLTDLFGGLAKTLVFGLSVAAIGCMRGLQTETGSSAVGEAATRAVVTGIVAIILVDGAFAVLYYYLGI